LCIAIPAYLSGAGGAVTLRKTTKRINAPMPKKNWFAKEDDEDDVAKSFVIRRRLVSLLLSPSSTSSSRHGVGVSFLDRSPGTIGIIVGIYCSAGEPSKFYDNENPSIGGRFEMKKSK
jgi:hypothetical protein